MSLDAYFRLYQKTAGITGTLDGTDKEFREIYRLSAVRVPPHRPSIREDRPDRLYRDEAAKLAAVVAAAAAARRAGRPVLIGTRDVAQSARLARALSGAGEKFELLNGLQSDEAAIVARAGRAGALTVATQIAGRGTDIKLSADARRAGGLLVLLTSLSESVRVDRQYRGRAGRQGEPGESRLFVSLEDETLVRRATASERAALDAAVREEGVEASGDIAALLSRIQSRAAREDSAGRDSERAKDDRLAPVRARYFALRAFLRAVPGTGLLLKALHRGWGDFLAVHEESWRSSTSGPSPDEVARSYSRLVLRPSLLVLLPHRLAVAALGGFFAATADYFKDSFYARSAGWLTQHTAAPLAAKLLSWGGAGLLRIKLGRAAAPLLRGALALRPDNWRAQERLARAVYATAAYDGAAREFQALLSIFWRKSQQFDTAQRRILNTTISNLALSLDARSRGRTPPARALDLNLAYELDPTDARHAAQQKSREGLTVAELAAVDVAPPYMGIVYLDKARTAVDRNNFKAAKHYFSRVIEIDPTSATAFVGRGYSEKQLGEEADAGRDLNEALRLRILSSRQFNNMRLAYSLDAGVSLDAARLDEAFAELNRGGDEPEPAATGLSRKARDYDERGVKRFQRGEYRAAYADFADSLMWEILDDGGAWNHLIAGHTTRAEGNARRSAHAHVQIQQGRRRGPRRRAQGQGQGAALRPVDQGGDDFGPIGLFIHALLDRVHAAEHSGQVDPQLGGIEPVARGGARVLSDLGGLEQRLARDAARPCAVAAELVLLDEERLRAELRAHARRRQSGRASSDNDDVVFVDIDVPAVSTSAADFPTNAANGRDGARRHERRHMMYPRSDAPLGYAKVVEVSASAVIPARIATA